ncbi:hypothetical protein MANES_11G000650v8 [Manihot esculenta]|nr:hypothetical protein MANES_11G000650v8 [Manihot esculenta]KAG8643069.1 hypothetical protein MANES_11G000650v8 [Manihot esculenta]
MVRGKDGTFFSRCEECKKDVPVALVSVHSCCLVARIKMNLEAQDVENPAEVKKKTERKKATLTEPKAKKAKKEKKRNNPNALPLLSSYSWMNSERPSRKQIQTIRPLRG